jgi:hypothetical protein
MGIGLNIGEPATLTDAKRHQEIAEPSRLLALRVSGGGSIR